MNLTFTHSSQSSSCQGQDVLDPGTLAGVFHFDTETTKWGHVGKNAFSFLTPTLDVFTDNGLSCAGGGSTLRCYRSTSWTGPSGSHFVRGYEGSFNLLSYTHMVKLSDPAGATREDDLGTTKAAAPSLNSGVLSITTAGGFSGRATISGGSKTSNTQSCKRNGVTHTEKVVNVDLADWKTPKANRFTAHLQIPGAWAAPLSASTASYTIASFS
jgi:hypothetical protein